MPFTFSGGRAVACLVKTLWFQPWLEPLPRVATRLWAEGLCFEPMVAAGSWCLPWPWVSILCDPRSCVSSLALPPAPQALCFKPSFSSSPPGPVLQTCFRLRAPTQACFGPGAWCLRCSCVPSLLWAQAHSRCASSPLWAQGPQRRVSRLLWAQGLLHGGEEGEVQACAERVGGGFGGAASPVRRALHPGHTETHPHRKGREGNSTHEQAARASTSIASWWSRAQWWRWNGSVCTHRHCSILKWRSC